MPHTQRRWFLGGLALGAGGLARTRIAYAAPNDGHAAGYDVSAAQGVPLIPRKPGETPRFTFPLDAGPIKATSGGWARDVTMRQLPIATGLAGAHLFVEPGGAREMHWHTTSAEWAFILAGQCQVTVVDPSGETEVVNLSNGDLWYFPMGHSHSIQTLGTEPCHALLVFDDGLYGEHGTFGLSDWLSLIDPALVSQDLGIPASTLAGIPKGETYIMKGDVIPLDSAAARATRELPPDRTHRHALMQRKPFRDLPGGTLHLASAAEFPASKSMSGTVLRLQENAIQGLHWHPNANEWFYVSKGRGRITLFSSDKHLGVADVSAGDCGYIPQGFGHSVQALGPDGIEIIGCVDSGSYQEASLADWMANAPAHVLANNLSTDIAVVATFPKARVPIRKL